MPPKRGFWLLDTEPTPVQVSMLDAKPIFVSLFALASSRASRSFFVKGRLVGASYNESFVGVVGYRERGTPVVR